MNDYSKNSFRSLKNDDGSVHYFFCVNRQWIEVEKSVFRVCRNSYEKMYRDNKKDKKAGLLSLDYICETGASMSDYISNDTVSERIIMKLLIEQLKEAMLKMSELDQKIIFGLYFEGLTEDQLAERLGYSKSGLNRRKHRIIQNLRKILKIE